MLCREKRWLAAVYLRIKALHIREGTEDLSSEVQIRNKERGRSEDKLVGHYTHVFVWPSLSDTRKVVAHELPV